MRERPKSRAPGRRAGKPSGWPTLEEQLSQATVVHGSPLEMLIRENQDFQILREGEKADNLGLPPWIRVYWRKAHPEGNYSAKDASGGYPRVLRRTLAWMVSHQDLRPDR